MSELPALPVGELPGLSISQVLKMYVPQVVLAALVLILGLWVAGLLRRLIRRAGERLGVPWIGPAANGCFWLLVAIVALAAAGQLGMRVDLAERLLLIAFAGLALAAGLAGGLGCRHIAGGLASGYILRQRLQAGDRVTVVGISGTVREVGPVTTTIESEEEGLLHRHTVPNTVMLSRAVR